MLIFVSNAPCGLPEVSQSQGHAGSSTSPPGSKAEQSRSGRAPQLLGFGTTVVKSCPCVGMKKSCAQVVLEKLQAFMAAGLASPLWLFLSIKPLMATRTSSP